MGWSPTASVVSVLPGVAAAVTPGAAVDKAVTTSENPAFPDNADPATWARWTVLSAPGLSISAPGGLHRAPQALCQSPANESEGQFVCGAGLSLPVPASSAASTGPGFEATLTLTLTVS